MKLLRLLILALPLLAGGSALHAQEDELCTPFRDGVVNEALLTEVLSAARDGHLYRIEQASSRVGFCVNSNLRRIEGNFRDFSGGMTLGNASDGQTLMLIRSDSLDVEGGWLREILLGRNFFNAADHPEILFVSEGLDWTGDDSAILRGKLTLRGITRPVAFDVVLVPAAAQPHNRYTIKATTTINREDFGMDRLKLVADSDVQLCITAEAQQVVSIGPLASLATDRQR